MMSDFATWHHEARAYESHGDETNATRCREIANACLVEPRVTIAKDERNPRKRARLIPEPSGLGASVSRTAQREGKPVVWVDHAGTVANAYKYQASTQCFVAIGLPDGRAAVWAGEIEANKATDAGVLTAMVGDRYRAILDLRYGEPKRAQAKAALVEYAIEVLDDAEEHA